MNELIQKHYRNLFSANELVTRSKKQIHPPYQFLLGLLLSSLSPWSVLPPSNFQIPPVPNFKFSSLLPELQVSIPTDRKAGSGWRVRLGWVKFHRMIGPSFFLVEGLYQLMSHCAESEETRKTR